MNKKTTSLLQLFWMYLAFASVGFLSDSEENFTSYLYFSFIQWCQSCLVMCQQANADTCLMKSKSYCWIDSNQ